MAKRENILQFFHGEDMDKVVKERILVYGRAGVGKTRFGDRKSVV